MPNDKGKPETQHTDQQRLRDISLEIITHTNISKTLYLLGKSKEMGVTAFKSHLSSGRDWEEKVIFLLKTVKRKQIENNIF